MYLRRTARTIRGKTYLNYQLVESVRTPKGPRQRTICSLGDLGPASRQEGLGRAPTLGAAVAGQHDMLERDGSVVDSVVENARRRRRSDAADTEAASGHILVDPDLITTERHREAGPVHVGHQFWMPTCT